ncbi:MAG: hypothetical protein PWQ55_844 [Chloroflexota bacterium]|nr:hypothetical protein [Chloroflexota bacterium]
MKRMPTLQRFSPKRISVCCLMGLLMLSTGACTPPASTEPAPAAAAPQSSNQASRDGITIVVEKVLAEADRLVISYEASGLPADFFQPEHTATSAAGAAQEPQPEQIILPGGQSLAFQDGLGCQGSGDGVSARLACQIAFAPLPSGTDAFTFVIPRLPDTLPGELPEDWHIPVQLLLDSTPESVREPGLRSAAIAGITLQLLKTSRTPAQTEFQLGMEWEGQDRLVHHTAPVTLQDDLGRYYILTGGSQPGRYSADNPNFSTLFSLATTPLEDDGPLTVQLDWIIMSAFGNTRLQFRPEEGAQAGQEWALDEEVSINDFNLHFTRARLKGNADGSLTYEFEIKAPADVVSVNLSVKAPSFSSDSGYDAARNVLVSRISLPELPEEPLEFGVSEVLYKVEGPWQITWQPEAVDFTAASPTPAPTRMAAPTPTLIPDQPILADLQDGLQRTAAQYPQGPGWVHQVLETHQSALPDQLNSGDLPAQPLDYRVDAWYLLDESGYARTTVYIRKSLAGEFLSADITNGIYHFSLPEGRGSLGQDVYLERPAFDHNLFSAMNGYVQEGGSIRQQDDRVDGVPCRSYIASLPYDPPQDFSGEALPVQAMTYAACFDPASAELLQVQNSLTYTDGTTHLSSTTRFLSIEKVGVLPEEVSQLLEQVIMP